MDDFERQAHEDYRRSVIKSAIPTPIGMDAYYNQYVVRVEPRMGDWHDTKKVEQVEPPVPPDIEVRCEACGKLTENCKCHLMLLVFVAFVMVAAAMVAKVIIELIG